MDGMNTIRPRMCRHNNNAIQLQCEWNYAMNMGGYYNDMNSCAGTRWAEYRYEMVEDKRWIMK